MDITPNGNLLILASRAGRVVSMDVSNPANPTILDDSLFVTTSGWTNSVVIVNDYAFVSTDPNHIHAVNISDPANLAVDATISDNMVEDIGHLQLVGENIYYTSIGNDRFGLLELSCDIESSGPPDLGACTKTAAIDFESAAPLYKYCDGSNWRPMTCMIEEREVECPPIFDAINMSKMGATIDWSHKWDESVIVNNNKIYAIPSDGTDILVIDTTDTTQSPYGTATRTNMGASLTGGAKWAGGAVADNGKIYAIPINSTDILVIDPSDPTGSAHGTATRTNMGATLNGTYKWAGATRANNGKIYGIPSGSSNILVIDPSDPTGGPHGTASRTAMGASLTGGTKWCGGVQAANGKIYASPYDATDILVIDPSDLTGGAHGTATRTNMGATIPTGNAKWCGVVEGPNKKLYSFPFNDANEILIIDPFDLTGGPHGTATLSNMGATIPTGSWKWIGGVRGPDGKLYSVPDNAVSIVVIDTKDLAAGPHGTASVPHSLPHGGWTVGHTAANGYLYMPPMWSDTTLVMGFADGDCKSSMEERCAIRRDPCQDSPGSPCNDGTIYAGLSPDGNLPMFTTPEDNQLSGPPHMHWGSYGISRGVTNGNTGRSNTNTLAGFGAAAHPVAHYCNTLTAHGRSDWYLPSRYELHQIMQNADAIGNFIDQTSLWYWSSTEFNSDHAYINKPTLNPNAYTGKSDTNPRSRCVRKGS